MLIKIPYNHVTIIICCILSIEIFIRFNLNIRLYSVLRISKKVYRIIKSSKVSSHWKEKMVPYYALEIFKISFSMYLILFSIVLIYFLPYIFKISIIEYCLSYKGVIETLFISFIYLKIRFYIF
jgi:hypothetical protein